MAFKFPEPPHGWQALGWEIGVVVVGVLIALGAQEFVQSLHWRGEVRDTRQAMDAELSRNLAVFKFRLDESECITARMAEITKWAESFRAGRPLQLKHEVINTPGFTIRTEVWDLLDNDVASRIPLKDRLNYAGLYSNMKTFKQGALPEVEAWEAIMELQDSTKLDEADTRKITLAAKGLAGSSAGLAAWQTAMGRQARELGLKPDPTLVNTADPIMARMRQEACEPYL